MVVLLILGFVFVAFSASLMKIANIDLTKEYVETAVYAGLWKSQLYKDYKSNKLLSNCHGRYGRVLQSF